MEESTFVKCLPWTFKICTSLDIKTGEFNKFLISCRFLIGASLFILTFLNIVEDGSGGGKYAKTHDLLIILILALSEATFIKRKKQALTLVRYLLKPRSEPLPLEISRRFLRFTNIFGTVVTAVFAVSFFWSFTPLLSFGTPDTNATTTFHFPLHWISTCSESFLLVVSVAAASVFYILSGLIHFFTWYPTIAFCAIKIKLMVKLLTLDVELVDDKAERLSRDAIDNIVATGRLPFCEQCRDPPDRTADRSADGDELAPGNVIKLWKFDSRECCKTDCKENLKAFYVNKLLDRIVEKHIEIIRFVRLVDKSFQLSVLMYNQFAVVAAVLLVPKVSNVQSMTGSEIMIVIFEVLGVLSTIGIFNYCGQIVLNESDEIRSALHSYVWYEKPISTKRRLLIMLAAASRPLKLTSGGIHTLSNETYSTILSAAYSYASVLQSLKASGE